MKGLLRKEFYCAGGFMLLAAYAAIYPLLILVSRFTEVGFASMGTMLIIIQFALLPYTVDMAEARARWRTYAKVLPYSRRQFVDAKYLFSLLAALTAACMNTVFTLLRALIEPNTSADKFEMFRYPAIPTAALTAAIILYTAAFLYPFYFRSIRRGNSFLTYFAATVLGLVYALPFGIPAFIYFISMMSTRPEPVAFGIRIIPYILLAVSLAVYPLSWLLSHRLYCRQKRRKPE